ncbi:acyl-CoA carboxylase subunit epsilon [Streptomyces sp. TLI_185]|uniref:acyl-CoA carboxylase subunit epsilon n=1 Tax=Streptomyces sp. TLI_185 TaxID=2485151 RepID=UPI000F4E62DF|nr:acyl-CoA carboxylase subunit epsilon [Streptomyces sp. TLI_185]RPF24797.1 acyl-CoA carboxylase epsilon subunit-like protein [Streptomyces sp. TLI_185]
MDDTDRAEPALRVERGMATEEELAALTVVLLALRGRPADEGAPPRPVSRPRWWLRPWGYQGSRGWR